MDVGVVVYVIKEYCTEARGKISGVQEKTVRKKILVKVPRTSLLMMVFIWIVAQG